MNNNATYSKNADYPFIRRVNEGLDKNKHLFSNKVVFQLREILPKILVESKNLIHLYTPRNKQIYTIRIAFDQVASLEFLHES